MNDTEVSELHCHECNGYVQYKLDLKLSGRHVITCPKCDHQHFRMVVAGRITEDRWDPVAPTWCVTSAATMWNSSSCTHYLLDILNSASTDIRGNIFLAYSRLTNSTS